MKPSNVVVCSFYTADDYYRGHAETLRRNLDRLEIPAELQEIDKQPGEEWPDICRKKIPFIANVCERHPDQKVFWIDVDCQLLDLPPSVADFSADIIGFQRGFGSPLNIGYGSRTRFWEPCFFGINTTVGARKFIDDAQKLEANAEIRATDDYFFEESWRANASRLSFQVIPSISVLSKTKEPVDGVPAFFSFGASGQVAAFKGKVVQHSGVRDTRVSMGQRVRRTALKGAKALERRLPVEAMQRLRKVADSTGVTQAITGGGADSLHAGVGATAPGSPHRTRLVEAMIMSAQRGEVDKMNDAFVRLAISGVPSDNEVSARQVSESFAHYVRRNDTRPAIPLAWWPRPFPGNFGDWLSPLVVSHVSGHPVRYLSPTARSSSPHLVAVGSIGRFVRPRSIVVGTGISSTEIALEPKARWISVRGPRTAAHLAECGGPRVESFGDPGALLRRVHPVEQGETNGRMALVRHFTHARIPLSLPEDVDEIGVLMSHPDAVKAFIEQLHEYDGVITSAMHVMIVCHSYGIPCALVGIEGLESTVHGTGIKYEDYALGIGAASVHEPAIVPTDMRRVGLRDLLTAEKISDEKLDEIGEALHSATSEYLERHAMPEDIR